MSQNINQLTDDARIVEVVLFIENTSLPLERICALTKLNDEDAIDALRELKDHYLVLPFFLQSSNQNPWKLL